MEQQKQDLSLKNRVGENMCHLFQVFLSLCSITVQICLPKLGCWLFLEAWNDKAKQILHTFGIYLFEWVPRLETHRFSTTSRSQDKPWYFAIQTRIIH